MATHWDLDHIEGLAEIFSVSTNSEFVMSKAFTSKEFLLFIYALPDIDGLPQKTTQEFQRIFELCAERKGNSLIGPVSLASENQILLRDTVDIKGEPVEREIIALSPSTAAQVKSLEGFNTLLADQLSPVRNLRQLQNNHTSIVLWVKVGKINILLGADLEELGMSDDGWQGVINNGKIPPNLRCEIFKIPHHGSKNGHHADIWEKLVGKPNISVVTAFEHGSNNLPTNSDLQRISGFSDEIYLAGGAGKAIDRELKTILRKVDKSLQRKKGKLDRCYYKRK